MTATRCKASAARDQSHARTTLLGIGLMLAGVFLFCMNDVMGKWLVSTYSVGQVLLIRSCAALIVLAPIVWRAGRQLFTTMPRPGLQLMRVLLGATEVAMFYWSVVYLPLADAVTYYLAGPIYVTAISAVFLGERVGWQRWTAVLVGFAGVLIALNPSPATFSWPALIALAGSLMYAVLLVTTRVLRGTADLALVSTQIATTLVLGAMLAPLGWVTPSADDLSLLALLGVVAMGALTCINRSLKLAPASVVVPYQYTMILWAVLLGYLVFGDVPQLHVVIGSAVIVAAGLFIFWREQVRARASTRPVASGQGHP
jgi:drug/metabolite transporter (DMT)-like permease